MPARRGVNVLRRVLAGMVVSAYMLAAIIVPAGAEPTEVQYVTGPGSYIYGFQPPVIVLQQGDGISYSNVDVQSHNIIAICDPRVQNNRPENCGPDDLPWCAPANPDLPEDPRTNPRQRPLGECPIFWSTLAALAETIPVLGLEATPPGEYTFICELHAGAMANGILEVLERVTP